MTIDEAIAKYRELASEKMILSRKFETIDNKNMCISLAEEHEQLAEWLKELKAYKEIGTVEECRNSILDILKTYNKAIDDMVEHIIAYYMSKQEFGYVATTYEDLIKYIYELSEHLKGSENIE